MNLDDEKKMYSADIMHDFVNLLKTHAHNALLHWL